MKEATIKKVLDHGYVELIECWGRGKEGGKGTHVDYEVGTIEAARMSTGKGFLGWGTQHSRDCQYRNLARPSSCDPGCKPGDEKLLTHLYTNNHATPFEMAGMIIEVKAPIFVFREWHRHRTQSYNEMSARYIPLPDENYIPSVERLLVGANTATTNKQAQGNGKQLDEETAIAYQRALETFYKQSESLYQEALQAGVPKELARVVLPVARYSRMRASANLRNWFGFLKLRQSTFAQHEIRVYADAIGELIEQEFPRTWDLYCKETGHGKSN